VRLPASVTTRALALLLAFLPGCASKLPEPVDPASKMAAYDAPVIAYLEGLGADSVGRVLDGVHAEPGAEPPSQEMLLKDEIYLGKPLDVPPHVHIHLLQRHEKGKGEGKVLAYLWVDTAGEPFPLPECDPGRVGFRARRVWGPIYTWKAARPGDGVLVSECPPDAWVESAPGEPRPAG